MKKDIQGIDVKKSKKLLHWGRLLNEWGDLVRYYCDFMKNDAPFFYTERANIGLLSAAAWKIEWIALEEFGARKRGIKQGRCDLYIYPNGKRKGEYIEAKQVWSKYNERKEEWNLNQIQPSLTLAMKNAQDIIVSKDDPSIKIGLIFIAPYIYRDCKHKIDHHIETIIKDVPSARYDAFAWSFPAIVRNLNGGGQYKNFIFPGVMLLASVVEKKN